MLFLYFFSLIIYFFFLNKGEKRKRFHIKTYLGYLNFQSKHWLHVMLRSGTISSQKHSSIHHELVKGIPILQEINMQVTMTRAHLKVCFRDKEGQKHQVEINVLSSFSLCTQSTGQAFGNTTHPPTPLGERSYLGTVSMRDRDVQPPRIKRTSFLATSDIIISKMSPE